jgi:hypothetical protein
MLKGLRLYIQHASGAIWTFGTIEEGLGAE